MTKNLATGKATLNTRHLHMVGVKRQAVDEGADLDINIDVELNLCINCTHPGGCAKPSKTCIACGQVCEWLRVAVP